MYPLMQIDRHITQHLMLTFQNVSCLNCVHRQPCPHTGTQRIRRPHIDRIRLNDEKVVSAYWSRNNQTTTYWEKTIEYLNAQQFQLILPWTLFTGRRVQTLKQKEWDHHILTENAWRIWCWTVPIFSWLNSVHMWQHPHIKRERNRPQHVDRNRLMIKCSWVPIVS